LTLVWKLGWLSFTVGRLVCVGLAALVLGCSTTSTIYRVSEPDVEGTITGGSPNSIFVEMGGGEDYEIARSDIASIDYPGNVHATVGGVLLGYGILNIAVGMEECQNRNDDQAAFCAGVFSPAALGIGMLTWGLVVLAGQSSAAKDESRVSMLTPEERPRGNFPSWTRARPDPAGSQAPAPQPAPAGSQAPAPQPATTATAPAPAPAATPPAAPPGTSAPSTPAPPPAAPAR
jgi:hypothetical protein